MNCTLLLQRCLVLLADPLVLVVLGFPETLMEMLLLDVTLTLAPTHRITHVDGNLAVDNAGQITSNGLCIPWRKMSFFLIPDSAGLVLADPLCMKA